MNTEGINSRNPGPDRILGLGEQSEAHLRNKGALEILEKQGLEAFEREKTPEEMEIIFNVLDRMPDFIREYGSVPERFVSAEQVHILDETKADSEEVRSMLESGTAGTYSPVSGRIKILPKQNDYLHMAHVLVHELVHANSFSSMSFDDSGAEGKKASLRRLGLSANEKGNTFPNLFKFLNEAVTEELTIRFCEKYFMDIRLTREAFNKYEREGKPAQVEEFGSTFSVVEKTMDPNNLYSYANERFRFASFAEAIFHNNKDRFESYEDVLKVFSQAMFTGNLLPIARLVEKTYGKGSFRKVGKTTEDKAPDMFEVLEKALDEVGLLNNDSEE